MKISFSLLFVLFVVSISCSQKGENNNAYYEAEKVFEEALQIHDEVMPLMGDIIKLQSNLRAKKENITDENTLQKINETMQNLENAHNAMMVWMRNVTQVPDNIEGMPEASDLPTPEEMLKIQEKSLQNIEEVKAAIIESMERANSLLSTL